MSKKHNISNLKLPNIDRARTSEDDFIDDLIEGCDTCNFLVRISISLIPDINIEKIQQGILTGHMVRAYKLYDTLIYLLTKNRLESALVFYRLLLETSLNLRYLLHENKDDLYKKFIKSGLAYDKKLWDEINNRKKSPPLEIEKRMLESIEKRFKQSHLTIEEVQSKDTNWRDKSLYQIAENLNVEHEYEFGYRTSSQVIHGSWSEMIKYHLRETNDHFEPFLEYQSTRPQIVSSASTLLLRLTKEYAEKIYQDDSNNLNLIMNALNEAIEWYKKIDEQHEAYLAAS